MEREREGKGERENKERKKKKERKEKREQGRKKEKKKEKPVLSPSCLSNSFLVLQLFFLSFPLKVYNLA